LAVGAESDRLVFDYLSKVGDLAQTALPAARRVQLVARLRTDIDRERGGSDTPAAVRRILGRIGSPDEVVEAAAGSTGSSSGASPGTAAGSPPYTEPPPGSYGPYAKAGPGTPGTPRPPRASRSRDDEPDWWRVDPGGGGSRAGDELTGLTGMTGGVFIPMDDEDLAEKDLSPGPAKAKARGPQEDGEAHEEEAGEPRGGRRLLPRLGKGGGKGGGKDKGKGKGWGSPVLLLAAALLIVGAAIGSWIPLGLGWGAGYLSRRLSRTQAKLAVLGIPGAAAGGTLVWLWGRQAGKWGTPVAQGQMGQALQDALPGTVRLAAIGSALYLLWRARRAG
jgi:hypothetical protein